MTKTLAEMATEVLTCGEGREKTEISKRHAEAWFAARKAGTPIPVGTANPPLRPSRPAKPELLDPRDVPRRKPGTPEGRIAILHAVAHIELNAVDLHWDLIARFSDTPMPIGFYDDWVKAADEESKHFNLMCDCLEELGSFYGALPAHAGMWRAAEDTVDDLHGPCAHGQAAEVVGRGGGLGDAVEQDLGADALIEYNGNSILVQGGGGALDAGDFQF